ncbi:uncharacterized protein LOC109834152 isoform X3 [Asparagus officinalis]|uniref:uncharacterized protein LOC109834152 isoform X3 n=1 Tax=Asparagus officinalis TaxID=4686 RepID=UPI00098E12EA|nr:uncharacterized protein LOC109834152 isoform X3 [Asparagus officinalis]
MINYSLNDHSLALIYRHWTISKATRLEAIRFLHSKKEKHFLYDIVANGRTGLDKFDIVDGSRRNMKACTRALAKKMIYLSFVLYMKAMMMDPGVCSQDKRHTKVKIGGHEDIRSGKGSALQLNDLLRGLSPSDYVLHAISNVQTNDLERTLLNDGCRFWEWFDNPVYSVETQLFPLMREEQEFKLKKQEHEACYCLDEVVKMRRRNEFYG